MARKTGSGFFLLLLFVSGIAQGTETVTLYSQAVVNAFIPAQAQEIASREKRDIPALSGIVTPLGAEASAIARAKNVPVKVVSYGSGKGIAVTLALEKGAEKADKADLIRTVMSAAASFYKMVGKESRKSNRPVIARLIIGNGASADSDVRLAEAVFFPEGNTPEAYAFPGSAWKRVVAADRVPDDLEVRYLRRTQVRTHKWGLEYDDWVNGRRSELTREQDAELSKELGIKPGTVKVTPFVLRPL